MRRHAAGGGQAGLPADAAALCSPLPPAAEAGTLCRFCFKASPTSPPAMAVQRSQFDIGPGYKAVKHLGALLPSAPAAACASASALAFFASATRLLNCTSPPAAALRPPACRPGRHGRHLALQGPVHGAGCGGEVHQAAAAQGAADQHPARIHGRLRGCFEFWGLFCALTMCMQLR